MSDGTYLQHVAAEGMVVVQQAADVANNKV